jgi:hypothetical protein
VSFLCSMVYGRESIGRAVKFRVPICNCDFAEHLIVGRISKTSVWMQRKYELAGIVITCIVR